MLVNLLLILLQWRHAGEQWQQTLQRVFDRASALGYLRFSVFVTFPDCVFLYAV